MLESIWSIFTSIVYNSIASIYLMDCLGSKFEGKKKYFSLCIYIIISEVINKTTLSLIDWLPSVVLAIIGITSSILFLYLFCLFCLKGSRLQRVFNIFISILLFSLCSFLTSFINAFVLSRFNIQRNWGTDLIYDAVSIIVLIYAYRLALNFKQKDGSILRRKDWIIIIISPMFSLIIMILLLLIMDSVTENVYTVLIGIIAILLLTSNIITYYLYINTIKNNKSALRLERMKQQQEYEKRHYDEQTKKYDEIRMIRHNIKNQLLYLQTAIKEERSDEAVAFINKFTQDIENTGDFVRTNNYAFNCILNAMIAKAKESDIRVKVQITENVDTNLDPADTSVILGNLLENAIEACNKLNKNKRKIGITIEQNLIGLMIRIGNSTGVSVIRENPDFLTDKLEKEQHGLGVKSVRKIVQKHDGLMTCHEEDDTFYWTILFKKSADLV